MIERYTLPEMGKIWTESSKFQSWLKVEIAACEANFSLGKIPENAMKEIRSNAKFDESRITEIEKEVKHDVIAFLTSVNEFVGDSGRYIHVGMTSSDVLDTGLALQMRASVKLLRKELAQLENSIHEVAKKHKNFKPKEVKEDENLEGLNKIDFLKSLGLMAKKKLGN